MMQRRTLVLSIAAWSALAAGLTVYTAANTNPDARWIVFGAGLIGVLAAASAAISARAGNFRLCGLLLIVSAVTPSGFFYLPNVVALLGGVVLVTLGFIRADHSSPTSAEPV